MTSPPPPPQQSPGPLPAPREQPPGPPPPTGYPPPYLYPPPYVYTRRTNVMAILALVFGFVFSPAAIVLGHIARKQIRETGEDGDGFALAGLIMGYLFTGLLVAFCLGYVVFFIAFMGTFATVGSL